MMERALKERIIGAVVLVVFVVLVVPIFLDGPPDDAEIVSQSVLLPGQEEQKTQTVVLDRDRTEPVPAATQPTPAPVEQTREEQPAAQPAAQRPAPVVEQREEAPTPVAEPVQEPPSEPERTKPEPVAASTTGMWAVQLGSFSNKENAERLASDLRKQGYAAFISEVSTNSGQMHRVRIGPLKDRPSAEQMAARLAKVGHDGKVVPHP